MRKLTLIFAAIVLSFSASTAYAMNGQADRYNEQRSFPQKAMGKVVEKVSAKSTGQGHPEKIVKVKATVKEL